MRSTGIRRAWRPKTLAFPDGKVLIGRARRGGSDERRELGRAVQAISSKDGSPGRRGQQGRGAKAVRRSHRPGQAAEGSGQAEGRQTEGSNDGARRGGDRRQGTREARE